MHQQVDVRPSASRNRAGSAWLESKRSFSFGAHYDPGNTHHGVLVVHNEDVVQPGTGFDTHPHRDMEIVTWVLEGSLVHEDSAGHAGVIYPGLAQRMSAGSGIRHSEKNDSARPVRFVQAWVLPDTPGIEPGYEQRDIGDELQHGRLVPVASGRPGHSAAIRIAQRDAALHVARLTPGESVLLPDAPFVHLFVARGGVELESTGSLTSGDAARVTGVGGQRVTASGATEILVWEMHATPAA
ncbi:pirin family protein [Cryptosporangium arvum]|uniref:Pirin-related protein n=1 Tax=Cryptosporangium arvum DSM 44712 TaxID=927661 RepID=A0A010YIK2_9ACTN|nr:pirin-like bicupin family protein [Cryptosporangium arvum]EXG80085.1 Pirin-related protein [Cryptosporangium arvum DSM 44712]